MTKALTPGTIPAMNETFLPCCCTPLHGDWPFAQQLPGAHLINTTFDPAQFDETDFTAAGIAPVRGVAKRQAEHLAGRLCAREALRRLTGTAYVPGVGEDRAPQWPVQVCGSITHGQSWAAAIVAYREHWQGLGLDVERLLPVQRAERLAAEILTPQEQRRIARLDPRQQAWHISLTFSLKESLFKALYPLVLKRFYFHDAELLAVDTRHGTAQMRLLLDLSEQWPAGSELPGLYTTQQDRLLSLVYIAP